jgi:hypothetical protein
MAHADVQVPIKDAIRRMYLTVEITGQREWAIRSRLGFWLMHLAATIMGVGGLDVQFQGADQDETGGPS